MVLSELWVLQRIIYAGIGKMPAFLFAQHGQTLTGESPEHAQIVGNA